MLKYSLIDSFQLWTVLWEVIKGAAWCKSVGLLLRRTESDGWHKARLHLLHLCTVIIRVREAVQKMGGGGQWDFVLRAGNCKMRQ